MTPSVRTPLVTTPEPVYAKLWENMQLCVYHPGRRFQEEAFGNMEPSADHPSTSPVSLDMLRDSETVIRGG